MMNPSRPRLPEADELKLLPIDQASRVVYERIEENHARVLALLAEVAADDCTPEPILLNETREMHTRKP